MVILTPLAKSISIPAFREEGDPPGDGAYNGRIYFNPRLP